MTDDFVIACSAFAAGALFAMIVTVAATSADWQAEAIERDLAQYCPADGNWA